MHLEHNTVYHRVIHYKPQKYSSSDGPNKCDKLKLKATGYPRPIVLGILLSVLHDGKGGSQRDQGSNCICPDSGLPSPQAWRKRFDHI